MLETLLGYLPQETVTFSIPYFYTYVYSYCIVSIIVFLSTLYIGITNTIYCYNYGNVFNMPLFAIVRSFVEPVMLALVWPCLFISILAEAISETLSALLNKFRYVKE